jgi:hypothetical protein
MPLNEKGKKILNSMKKQYGTKKGESVFYAMENSGKLRKVLKARGGKDASQADFGGGTPGPGDTGGEGGYTQKSTNQFGAVGSSPTSTGGPNVPQARTGPAKLPVIGPFTYAFNKVSKSLYNKKNLEEQKKEDVLGGEMLTTAPKQTQQATIGGNDNNRSGLCPDGTNPPCKTPATQYVAPKQTSNFLQGFKSYDEGGEIVISSNVDKDLL